MILLQIVIVKQLIEFDEIGPIPIQPTIFENQVQWFENRNTTKYVYNWEVQFWFIEFINIVDIIIYVFIVFVFFVQRILPLCFYHSVNIQLYFWVICYDSILGIIILFVLLIFAVLVSFIKIGLISAIIENIVWWYIFIPIETHCILFITFTFLLITLILILSLSSEQLVLASIYLYF